MKKVALITGITGQDGSYLAEHLLSLGYEVHGMVRRNSTAENQSTRLINVRGKITPTMVIYLTKHQLKNYYLKSNQMKFII